jgi:hypothetical protein
MAHRTIGQLEHDLANLPNGQEYVYAEVGRYKPFMKATIDAAMRRGYRVECKVRSSVYFVYPKASPSL